MSPLPATTDDATPELAERIITILATYVSRPTARSISDLARQRTGITDDQLDRAGMARLIDAMERGLRLFLTDPKKITECRAALERLLPGARVTAPSLTPVPEAPPSAPTTLHRAIQSEDDIAHARSDARTLATRLGFPVVLQTKLLTAVSELTRNIVLYAGSGTLDLTVTPDGAVEILAQDRGPGIPDLDQIMRGEYQSRRGMGLGLRGVKRLTQEFSVQTGVGRGTTVRAKLGAA